ncbi:MAG TPA: NrfD/PsrC family molybdoenzyme membrane anchor subunit, partial [Acidimicrobiales bacterium]|nr:NrfD/PsrC family molybdoenzyme membrane anchor subunit [Acidimicrobiales bacterium]
MTELRTYHGQPVLKQPVWSWEVPCYLFAGGMAGASATLACLSELDGNRTLARRAWAVALTGNTLGPVLLTMDLGKPVRALNMFRMFKVTSPMSVGSWLLAATGTTTGVSAANAWLGLFPRLSRATRPAAGILGLQLATYTAALLANTAVPLWHEGRRGLPFVFASGAAVSAGAASVMITPIAEARPARRLALGAVVFKQAMRLTEEQDVGELSQVYKQGPAYALRQISRGCLAAGASLLLARGGRSPTAARIAGGLLLASELSSRWSVFRAGFQSAADPKYVVGRQRAAIERGERRGAARGRSLVPGADPSVGSPATVPAG